MARSTFQRIARPRLPDWRSDPARSECRRPTRSPSGSPWARWERGSGGGTRLPPRRWWRGSPRGLRGPERPLGRPERTLRGPVRCTNSSSDAGNPCRQALHAHPGDHRLAERLPTEILAACDGRDRYHAAHDRSRSHARVGTRRRVGQRVPVRIGEVAGHVHRRCLADRDSAGGNRARRDRCPVRKSRRLGSPIPAGCGHHRQEAGEAGDRRVPRPTLDCSRATQMIPDRLIARGPDRDACPTTCPGALHAVVCPTQFGFGARVLPRLRGRSL